jgi:hypothetical protein
LVTGVTLACQQSSCASQILELLTIIIWLISVMLGLFSFNSFSKATSEYCVDGNIDCTSVVVFISLANVGKIGFEIVTVILTEPVYIVDHSTTPISAVH